MDEKTRSLLARLRGEDRPASERTHSELVNAREAADPFDQELLAPFEHRAFAREATRENPLMAAPILAATPLYYAAKKLGLRYGRTSPSVDQIFAGGAGVAEGLGDVLEDLRARFNAKE